VHSTNLDGVLLGCKHGIRAMRREWRGAIVNVSSRSGPVGVPAAATCASSKAALRNDAKKVALYCAAQCLSIRCTSIHPVAILTLMWGPKSGEGEVRRAPMAARVATRRCAASAHPRNWPWSTCRWPATMEAA